MKPVLIFGLCLLSLHSIAQTQFWSDDFEGTNSSSGTRTPENNGGTGGPPFTSYFCRTPATSTVSQVISFTGFQGSNYWAGEDHDAAGTGFNQAGTSLVIVREQDITWTGINISGKTGLSFKALLATNSTNNPFDNRNTCNGGATTNTDYIIIRYRINGGAWTDMLRFFSKGTVAANEKYLFQENTGDSCGDGTQLTNVFSEFSANIAGTGTTLDLQLVVYVEGSNEEWGADNFRLFTTSALPVSLIDFSVKAGNNNNLLTWTTTSEQNNSHFEIERSSNGIGYNTIGRVTGIGNSSTANNYSFVDKNPGNGKQYYRLKQVDLDGKSEYSKIITLTNEGALQLRIYPDPVTNSLKIDPGNNMIVKSIQLVDAAGKQLPLLPIRTGASFTYDLSGLAKGSYSVKLITEKGIITKQFKKLH